MADERDRRREADPLHDTVDESSGIVREAVDPDDTPIDKLIAAIRTEVGGYLTARDELMLREYEKHRERVQARSDQKRPPPPLPEVDRAQLASLLEHDMTGWPPFVDQAARLKRLEDAEAGRVKRRRWLLGSGVFSGATVLALLTWIATSLDARAYEAAQERLRVERLNEHHAVIEALKTWRSGVDFALANIGNRLSTMDEQIWGLAGRRRTRDGDNP